MSTLYICANKNCGVDMILDFELAILRCCEMNTVWHEVFHAKSIDMSVQCALLQHASCGTFGKVAPSGSNSITSANRRFSPSVSLKLFAFFSCFFTVSMIFHQLILSGPVHFLSDPSTIKPSYFLSNSSKEVLDAHLKAKNICHCKCYSITAQTRLGPRFFLRINHI